MKVRVWVPDVWDQVSLDVSGGETFGAIKSSALEQALQGAADPAGYEVKYRGALVTDENQTLEAASVPDGAPLIVLPARRRPVT